MAVFAITGSLTRSMPQYGAANGRGLSSFGWTESGRLVPIAELGGIDDTAWVLVDPRRGVLYSTFETSGDDQSSVAAFAIDRATGGLTRIAAQRTRGNEACHASLTPDGRFLLVANYNGATPAGWPEDSVSVFPLDAEGRIGLAVCSVRHRGRGPNAARQTTAHAHGVVPSPDGRMVYVADLGIDRIVAYAIDANGQLTAQPGADAAVPPGLGPRHLVFSADGRHLFMVSELIPTVMRFSVDPRTGALVAQQSIPIPPSGPTIVQPAGIALSPDGKMLVVGLRVCDELIAFRIDPATGALMQSGRWPAGGATPRDHAFLPDGRHLVVANQDADRLSVFDVDSAAGTLTGPSQQVDVGTPMTVRIAAV